MTDFEARMLELKEREVVAREKQAEALHQMARPLSGASVGLGGEPGGLYVEVFNPKMNDAIAEIADTLRCFANEIGLLRAYMD